MSTEAIFGISSIIDNVLLVCQSCVDLKKKDLIMEQTANSRDDQKINKLHTEIKELRAEIKANNLSLKTELHEIKAKTCEKTTPPAEPKLPKEPSYKKPANKFRGLSELNSKRTRDRYEHDLKEVKAIMKHLKVFCNVTDIKRPGKFSENKHRTLVVRIHSDYAKTLILLSLRKLKDHGKPVFISKDLNPEKQAEENEMLQMRRTL